MCNYIGCNNEPCNCTVKQITDHWLVDVYTCLDHVSLIHTEFFKVKVKEYEKKSNN